MKILHIAALKMNMSAGPTYSVPSYVNAQNNLKGITSDLLISIKINKRNEHFFYRDDFKNKESFLEFLKSYNIVIFHSTYIVEHVKIARMLKINEIPYVIVPRGGFTKGAKHIKKWKKKIGDFLVFKRFFNSPNSIQFLSRVEKNESVHRTDFDFILPNGISIPKIKKNGSSGGNINIVFIGRLDIYHKGLDLLVDAVCLIKNKLEAENVSIDLYGPDVRNSKQELTQLIVSNKIDNIIKINESIFSEEKTKVLCNADIFIQTSRFEGLPMGILEALSYGLPCILTPGTNLSKEVKDYTAGIEVMPEPKSISTGILTMIDDMKNDKLLTENAIALASNYSWESIAKKSIDKYAEIINRNECFKTLRGRGENMFKD